jgi:hypothetical protein
MIFAPRRPATFPSSPSALELDLSPGEMIHLLENLAAPVLVVRGGGISFFRKGALAKISSRILTKPLPAPSESAPLSIDPATIRRICLLRGQGGGPSLEVEFVSCGFALSVWYADDRIDGGMFRDLLGRYRPALFPWIP